MRVAVFSTKPYDREFLRRANAHGGHELLFFDARLTFETAKLAQNCPAVCAFVNDDLSERVLNRLYEGGTIVIAMRSAGYNNVDVAAAHALGMCVVRVPAYSPYAVAEHTLGLVLGLNRKVHRAYNRVREGNFALEGLLGFDLHGRTAGVIGTGKIGRVTAGIFKGFGMDILAYDPYPHPEIEEMGGHYVELDDLLANSDLISLHCPLTPDTYHLIDAEALKKMRKGAMLINTSRGALIDAEAAIEALKNGQLGSLGLDVYEEEADLFFEDLSGTVIQDDVFARLLTFPNVLITGHQAFFTEEALTAIATTTIANVTALDTACADPSQMPEEIKGNLVRLP